MMAESLPGATRAKRSEMMIAEVEAVALRLFEARGLGQVTVDEIAAEAGISPRTFYRYFPTKHDILLHRIERRTTHLRRALAARATDEPPLRSLRLAIQEAFAAEDPEVIRRWMAVIMADDSVLRTVLGGIQVKANPLMAEFLGSRLGMPGDALIPTMLAAAVGGIIQAAQTQWFFYGGSLAQRVSEGLEILERALGADPATLSATL